MLGWPLLTFLPPVHTAVYFTLAAGSDTPTMIRVVRTGPGTSYLRTAGRDARDDNLDELPPC